MRRPQHPLPLRVVRPAPSVLFVEPVAQRCVRPLPVRRRYVQALARLQVHPRRQHVHVRPTLRIPVQHCRPAVAVRLKASPGKPLELIQRLIDLLIGRLIFRRPGDHPRRVLVLELKRLGHVRNLDRIAAQHFHFLAHLPPAVQDAGQVVRCRLRRPRAMLHELNHHGTRPAPRPPAAGVSFPARWPPAAPAPRPLPRAACSGWPIARSG